MKELTLKGSFKEMGRQFGQASKKEIRTFARMSYMMASLAKKPGSQPFNPNLWYFIPTLLSFKREKSRWQSLAREYEKEILKYYPDAIEFMQGIAEGTGLPYIDILSLNVATENMLTCSAWGAAGTSTLNNEPLVGMNVDEETSAQKYETFLSVNPDKGFRYKVTAFAGWVGYNHGMNEKGLTFASTTLWTRPENEKRVRPPFMVLMKVLNTCSTVEEVKAYFESVPNHEVGTVFYIADPVKFMRVEYTPGKKVFKVVENGSLGNTNLIPSPELKDQDGSALLKQTLHAKIRSKRMSELLVSNEGHIDVDVMHKIASDHGLEGEESFNKSICQHPRGLKYNYKTLVSFIAQPKQKCFWVYEGNPCKMNRKKYDFNEN